MTPEAREMALATAITSLANHKHDHAGLTDEELARWIVATCLLFGSTVATAYQVAGLFIKGIRS